MKENIYRNVYCGMVDTSYVGKDVRIAGWVNSIRNLGSIVFLTIRDEKGIVQVVTDDENKIKDIVREATVTLTGKVRKREGDANPNMKTGEIEIVLDTIEVLGKCKNVLPFEISRNREATEETRLKYRYLDLRNEKNHENILLRSKVIDYIREIMKGMDFTEISTPIISTSSPEGARDFVIPSRNYKGKFYALPQAPQIYKQLLMVSGFNRYFQIAPCFRDEDCRADRTLEFYQLDLEMSFVTEEDVFEVGQKVFYDVFTKFGNKKVTSIPFPRFTWKEAMEKYGSDKPDLRNPLLIDDITELFKNTEFIGFKDKTVKAIKVESCDKANSWFKKCEEFVKEKGAGGLAYIKYTADGLKSTILKFLSDDEIKQIEDRFNLKEGNVLFLVAGNNINKIMGHLRNYLGSELNLINEDEYAFCIVNEFPMYEYNEEENRWDFEHNPFNMPKGGIEAFNTDDYGSIVANQYDFVCNGNEMASGAVRNHDVEIMKKAFEIAGYDETVIEKKFRSLYNAFQYGAPPHAGMAPGIDRIIMLLTGEENLREVQVFPPNVSGQDLLMGGPNELDEKQLRELHIKIRD